MLLDQRIPPLQRKQLDKYAFADRDGNRVPCRHRVMACGAGSYVPGIAALLRLAEETR